MNNGRIWCIVNPTVGIPLFLGAAALASVTVHYAILNNTTWFKAFWQGKAAGATASLQTPGSSVAIVDGDGKPTFVVNITPVSPGAAPANFAVRVEPAMVSTAEAKIEPTR